MPTDETSFSIQHYAAFASDLDIINLRAMLHDARTLLVKHGASSEEGCRALKKVAAARYELKRRGIEIPPFGDR